MNNLSNSFKKFISNKNTVTILGVVLCAIILYCGYRYRINKVVEFVYVPCAMADIQPRTEITDKLIDYKEVPISFLKGSEYYSNSEVSQLIGKYSAYNTIIPKGSFFYDNMVMDKTDLPTSANLDVKANETLISYKVTMDSTYANSMMPGDLIKIYFKARNDNNEIMFGKFLDNVKILAMKDGSGRHVFENSSETRVPAYMLFALPEDMHLLFRKALYLSGSYSVELILVPNTQVVNQDTAVIVSSKDIQDFINSKTDMVSVDEILSSTSSEVTTGGQ